MRSARCGLRLRLLPPQSEDPPEFLRPGAGPSASSSHAAAPHSCPSTSKTPAQPSPDAALQSLLASGLRQTRRAQRCVPRASVSAAPGRAQLKRPSPLASAMVAAIAPKTPRPRHPPLGPARATRTRRPRPAPPLHLRAPPSSPPWSPRRRRRQPRRRRFGVSGLESDGRKTNSTGRLEHGGARRGRAPRALANGRAQRCVTRASVPAAPGRAQLERPSRSLATAMAAAIAPKTPRRRHPPIGSGHAIRRSAPPAPGGPDQPRLCTSTRRQARLHGHPAVAGAPAFATSRSRCRREAPQWHRLGGIGERRAAGGEEREEGVGRRSLAVDGDGPRVMADRRPCPAAASGGSAGASRWSPLWWL